MVIDITKAVDFLIIIDDIKYRAALEETVNGKDFFFDLGGTTHLTPGELGTEAKVFFKIGSHNYYFEGKAYCQSPQRIIITRHTETTQDNRKYFRFETPTLPATLKEKGFLHTHTIDAHIVDLSNTGALISTQVELTKYKEYLMETTFPIRHALHSLSIHCIVKYCHIEQAFYLSGILFEQIGFEDEKTLTRYLADIQNK